MSELYLRGLAEMNLCILSHQNLVNGFIFPMCCLFFLKMITTAFSIAYSYDRV